MLYPLKFYPIIKEKVWGGQKLRTILNKPIQTVNAGESWELSAIKNDESIVSNGILKGKSLPEIIHEFKETLLGNDVFRMYGEEFPLLIKFIDAADDLSVQVHPDDEFAQKNHQSNGKNEIWYILETDPEAQLVLGLNRKLSKEEYMAAVESKTIQNILNRVFVKSGDVAFIPAGRIHAIMKGVLLAEIQQTSDITYRIYDWDRKDLNGQYRQLHTEIAAQVVDLEYDPNPLARYAIKKDQRVQLIRNKFFTINTIELSAELTYNIELPDGFVVLMILEGAAFIKSLGNEPIGVIKGETVLLPACLDDVILETKNGAKVLEIFTEPNKI